MLVLFLSLLLMFPQVDAAKSTKGKKTKSPTGSGAQIETPVTLLGISSASTQASLAELEVSFKTNCTTASTTDCNDYTKNTAVNSAETAAKASAAASLAAATANAAGSATSSSGVSTTGQAVKGASTLTNVAGPELICKQIKCDASDTQNTTCQTSCTAGCMTSYPVEIVYPKGDVNSESRSACQETCEADDEEDANSTDQYDNSNTPSTSSMSAVPYSVCITGIKADAKLQESKCRNLCKSIYNATLSKYTQASNALTLLSGLSGVIKGSSGTTKDNKGNTPTNNTNPSPASTGDSCAGKKGKQLSACLCKNNLNLDYDPATDSCIDTALPAGVAVSTTTPTQATGSSYGTPGVGQQDDKTKGTTETGAAGSGGAAAGKSFDAKAIAASEAEKNKDKDKDKNKIQSPKKPASDMPSVGGKVHGGVGQGANGEAIDEDSEKAAEELTDIGKENINIWDYISKTYQEKYESNEISGVN